MYWGIVNPLYSISLFLPTIINQLGYTATTAQLLTIPIYITAAILAVVVGYMSDKATKRGASRWPYVFVPVSWPEFKQMEDVLNCNRCVPS